MVSEIYLYETYTLVNFLYYMKDLICTVVTWSAVSCNVNFLCG